MIPSVWDWKLQAHDKKQIAGAAADMAKRNKGLSISRGPAISGGGHHVINTVVGLRTSIKKKKF